jgi:hypothetical protein
VKSQSAPRKQSTTRRILTSRPATYRTEPREFVRFERNSVAAKFRDLVEAMNAKGDQK